MQKQTELKPFVDVPLQHKPSPESQNKHLPREKPGILFQQLVQGQLSCFICFFGEQ